MEKYVVKITFITTAAIWMDLISSNWNIVFCEMGPMKPIFQQFVVRFSIQARLTLSGIQAAQSVSSRPIKFTIPSPLTIMDTNADCFYQDRKRLAEDLAKNCKFRDS